ncbi:MAG: YjjG family noncanonical pyrimidine nucleotidase [Clostridia bacterium]|nr:YjjG family noncanonical pyrimidine nucleotidase [Clostridia bacterium]
MRKYEYLLFDADNTLFDFTKAEYLAFRKTAESGGLPFSEQLYSQYSAINDALWKKLEKKEITLESLKLERFRQLLLTLDEPDNAEMTEKACFLRDTYIQSLGEQTCLIEGAEEISKELSERYTMYLVTNGIGRIQRARFGASALKPYFKDIFISEEIGAAKPSPAYFDAVFQAIGNPPKEKCLMIGDSLTSDCDGAIQYGIDICRYNPNGEDDKGRKLTYTVKKLSELTAIL